MAVLFWPSNNQDSNQLSFGITVFSPKSNEVISSPLKITGITNGDGWFGFEGQVGTVRLFNSHDHELALGILTAQGEWMQKTINFETTLTFNPGSETSGKLIFQNENPSGEILMDKTFTLSIKFK